MANIFDIFYQVIGNLVTRGSGGRLSLPNTLSRAEIDRSTGKRTSGGQAAYVIVNGQKVTRAIIGSTFKPGVITAPGSLPSKVSGKLGSVLGCAAYSGSDINIAAGNKIRVIQEFDIPAYASVPVAALKSSRPVYDGFYLNLQFQSTNIFGIMPFIVRMENAEVISSVDQNDDYILDAIEASLGAKDYSLAHGPFFQSRQIFDGKWIAKLTINLTPWVNAFVQRYNDLELFGTETSIPETLIGTCAVGTAAQAISVKRTLLWAYHEEARK
jgi:hypothetical protein